jgi:hypothetical protein
LKGEIELALEEEHGADELRAALRAAGEESDRLVRLAEDLLLLARADRGVLPLRREHVDLGSLLASMAACFELRAREAGRRIVVERTGLSVIADRLRLEQALSNLIDNALRHGGGTVRIHVTESHENVGLHVGDQGAGFSAPVAAHAFEPFARGGCTQGRGAASDSQSSPPSQGPTTDRHSFPADRAARMRRSNCREQRRSRTRRPAPWPSRSDHAGTRRRSTNAPQNASGTSITRSGADAARLATKMPTAIPAICIHGGIRRESLARLGKTTGSFRAALGGSRRRAEPSASAG